ncbi:hypothetical protein [Amycolatopsis sp. YIM 10]|uniref:sunset domain-containing protein n=1 Tax=Amycolatopsis sp. YIM 10 TaxID=2653857 RepID=UPI0012A93CE1|nr:hypothetical protein [Amycolatopsis sp. YIM 10]QFU94129.1 hypothetical protein YIM_44995 [Amycolatopsis sp. YIM 10]
MSIFTQVWLWSVAAFAIGVLLSVLLLVLPARKQVKELQRRLTAAEAAPREPTRQFTPEPMAEREPTRTFDPGPAAAATSYQPAFEPEPPRGFEPERTEAIAPSRTFDPQPEHTQIFEPGQEPRAGQVYEPDQARMGGQAYEADQALRAGHAYEPERAHQPGQAYEPEQARLAGQGFEPEQALRAGQDYEPELAARLGGADYEPEQAHRDGQDYGVEQAHQPEQAYEPEQAYQAGQGFEGEPEQAYEQERSYEQERPYGEERAYEQERPYNEAALEETASGDESSTTYQPAIDPEPIQSDIDLRSHYEDEPAEEARHARQEEPTHESVEQSWFSREQRKAEETVYYNGSGILDEERPGSLFTPAPADEEPPAYAFGDNEAEPSYEEELAAERTQVLPKRQPRQAPPGGFDPPQPIEPSVRQVERREPAPEQGQNSGSLFEPAVPAGANGSIPEAPPAREFVPEVSVPVGPFGPGSAMPKPGGGRPSDEFTVKASVTALRYCTEDSPQFPRMVAEVWFRSATDAERVGFRPLG